MTIETQPKENDLSRHHTMVRVAWLYYEEELTQAEIGERLGISRVTVNRILREARLSGIVEIKIRSDLTTAYPLAKQLCDRFGLKDVSIAQPAADGAELTLTLAKAAAVVLETRLSAGITVGIGIGRTMAYLPDYFRPAQPVRCLFTPLTGSLDMKMTTTPHNFDVVNRLAALTGGRCLYIPAPSFVSEASTRQVLLRDAIIAQSMDVARACDLAIFSVGSVDDSALLYNSGHLSQSDLAALRRRQAVGDVLGRFFDAQGNELDVDINQRIIGLTLAELKRVPVKILVAGGPAKRAAIRGLLQQQCADVLVTDLPTAQWLLNNP